MAIYVKKDENEVLSSKDTASTEQDNAQTTDISEPEIVRPTYGGNTISDAAYEYYKNLKTQEKGYNSPYTEQISALYDKVINPDKFNYNFQADPSYQQQRDVAIRNGRQSMMDTAGQSAALSGGYGNSYGTTASAQAYNEYLRSLNNVVPTLEQNAYSRYADTQGRNLSSLNASLGMDATEYQKWLTEREYNANAFDTELGRESSYWGTGSGSGSGSGGSGSGGTSIAKTENYSDYEKQQEKTNEIAYNAESMSNDREKLSKYLSASVSNGEIDADTAKQIFNKFYNGEVNIKSDTYDTYNSKSATGKDEPYKTTQGTVSSKLASSSAPESTKVSAYNSIVTYLNQRFKLGYITSSQRKYLLEEAADKMSLSV